MTSHIVHYPFVGPFQSMYCRKILHLLNKSHLNMLLSFITTVDTYKTIFFSILFNKQNNEKYIFLKSFISIGNYTTFISADKRTVL